MLDIQPDPRPIGVLLRERGITFTELSLKDNIVAIGLPDSDNIPLDTILYAWGLIEALGLTRLYLKLRGKYILVGP